MDVHLVWHVRHAPNTDGSTTQYRDSDGELAYDDEFDDLKVIGVYSKRTVGRLRHIARSTSPRVCDEPDCFMVDTYTVDEG